MMHRPTAPAYLIASLLLGIALGAVWDLLGILNLPAAVVAEGKREGGARRMTRLIRAAWRFACDLSFCLLAAVAVSLLAYALNRGKIRFLALLSMAGGFSLWYFPLSGRIRALAYGIKCRLSRLLDATVLRGCRFIKRRILRLSKGVICRLRSTHHVKTKGTQSHALHPNEPVYEAGADRLHSVLSDHDSPAPHGVQRAYRKRGSTSAADREGGG